MPQEQAGLDAVLHIIGIKQIAERIRGNQQIAVLFLAVHPVELVQDLPQLILAQLAHAMQTLELRKITRQIFFGRYTSHIFIAGAASDLLHIIGRLPVGA